MLCSTWINTNKCTGFRFSLVCLQWESLGWVPCTIILWLYQEVGAVTCAVNWINTGSHFYVIPFLSAQKVYVGPNKTERRCRGNPSLMLTSCQKKDGFRHWIVHCQENIEDMHVLEWFGGLTFLVCFVSMVKTLFRVDLKTRTHHMQGRGRPGSHFQLCETCTTRGQCLRKRMDGTDDVWRVIFLLWCYRKSRCIEKRNVCLFKIKVVLSLVFGVPGAGVHKVSVTFPTFDTLSCEQ